MDVSGSLAKGQNGPLAAPEIVLSIQVPVPADVSALLVTEQGRVRSDADFVFYNQPNGPGVQLQPSATGGPASLRVWPGAVPPDIAQVRAVITLADTNATFGQFAPPVVVVADAAGTVLYDYRIEGLSSESVVIALELYRRGEAWKVRAVGQGYAGGFAALVTDHGVTVDDAPAPPPGSVPPSPISPPPPPGYPSATPPAGQQVPGSQQSQPVGYPPPGAGYPPPAYPPQNTGYPPPAQPPQQPGYPPGQTPQSAPEVSLSKDRPISLHKGQRVSLRKDDGGALTFVKMGLGWDPVQHRGMFGNRTVDIDLDASVVLFAGSHPVDVVYYAQLNSKDGSIRHQGDNLTGEGEGDDETILVDLTRVPAHVTMLVFIVTSYKGHTFGQVQNAFCRLIDGRDNAELARYSLSGGTPHTAMVMATVFRVGREWKLQAWGEAFDAKHPGEAVPQLGRFVTG